MSLILAGSLFAFSSINTHASGTGDNPNFTPDKMSAEQVKAAAEKEAEINSKVNIMADPDGVYKTIGVPSYKQEKNYWCGPATVKQVVGFLKGSSSSQSTYASQLGTTTDGTEFSKVDDILNKNQSKNTYVYISIGSYSNWSNKIEYALSKNYPAVLDLKISPSYMPKYTSSVAGHILNVSGVDSTLRTSSSALVRLTDPFDQGGRGVTLGNVWHPHKGVYNANNAHFRQALLY